MARIEVFCREYATDQNGARAVRIAMPHLKASVCPGYAVKLLADPKIVERIETLRDTRARDADVNAARVLSELVKMGFSNMLDYVRVNDDGSPEVDFSKLTRDQAAAISSVTVDSFTDGRGEKAREVKRVKFTLYSKPDALKLLGQHLKLFTENINVTVESLAETIARRREELKKLDASPVDERTLENVPIEVRV